MFLWYQVPLRQTTVVSHEIFAWGRWVAVQNRFHKNKQVPSFTVWYTCWLIQALRIGLHTKYSVPLRKIGTKTSLRLVHFRGTGNSTMTRGQWNDVLTLSCCWWSLGLVSHVLNEVHNTVTVPIFIVIPENEEKTLKILILDYKERSTIKFDQNKLQLKISSVVWT